MLGAAARLRRGEPGDAHHAVHPRRRDVAGDQRPAVCAQTLAEALGGMAFVQLVRPGAPVVLGLVRELACRCRRARRRSGRRSRRSCCTSMAALARRLGVPFRSGGNLCASKIADAQAAYESAATFQPTILAGVNFVLHAAGWLEGGLAIGYEKFILDDDQCGMAAVFVKGVDLSENGQALDAIRENGPGQHFLGNAAHARQLRERVLPLDDGRQHSFEQWLEDGGSTTPQRANTIWKRMLAEYEAPPIDAGHRRGADRVHRPSARRRSRTRTSDGDGRLRRRSVRGAEASALARALEDPIFELIPIRSLLDQVPHLPPGALVSVTASPTKDDRGDGRRRARPPGGRVPGHAAPVGAHDPRPRAPRRPARPAA